MAEQTSENTAANAEYPTSTKLPDEVEVGDIIMFFGTPHRVATIEPYVHPIVTDGETWRIARAADGWGITLSGRTPFEMV